MATRTLGQTIGITAKLPWRRALLGLLVGLAALPLASVGALALLNNPIPMGSINGNTVVNTDGSQTLTLNGQWAFPAQTGDCNNAGRAAGYAIDWNDPSQPGNAVGSTSIDAGAAAANSYNPADNAVHPTPPTLYPSAWGGCGTYNSTLNYNTGAWGPISHTYSPGAGSSFNVCVVMYDVHLDSNGGQPNKASETIAGGAGNNGDNSADLSPQTGCQTVTGTPPVMVPEVPSMGLLTVAGLIGLGGAFAVRRRKVTRAVH